MAAWMVGWPAGTRRWWRTLVPGYDSGRSFPRGDTAMQMKQTGGSPSIADGHDSACLGRRAFLRGAAAAAAGLTVAARAVRAAERDWSGKEPVRYPDRDI